MVVVERIDSLFLAPLHGADVPVADWQRARMLDGMARAVAGRVNAPFSGVVRRLRLRSGAPGFVRVELVRLSKLDRDGGEAGAAAEKRSVKLFLHGRGIESFRVRLPVRKGDYLAFESASFTALRCTGDAVDDLIYEPLSAGPLDTVSDNDSCTLLVQALVSRK